MNLRNQRRVASELLKVGVNKVKFNDDRLEDAADAITREDIRGLIKNGVITAKPVTGTSKARARKRDEQKKKGRHKGQGTRRGTKNARDNSKEVWINKVRALRDELRKLKKEGKVTDSEYRKLYLQVKGNHFHSRRHLLESLERLRK